MEGEEVEEISQYKQNSSSEEKRSVQILVIMPLFSSLYPQLRLPHFKAAPEFGSKSPPSLFIKNSQQPECSNSLFPPANQSVAAIVFGDGSSHSRLYPLTKRRSEAAIPIAGNYRLIDSVVSNCINSDITKIYALTQFNSTSLNSHLARAYSGARLSKEGFVEVIAAYQSPEDNGWFQGTADAIRRCLWCWKYPFVEFLVLPGHHLYKMDYQRLVDAHRQSKADITVSVFSRTKDEDFGFGIFKLNAENQVLEFRENPGTNAVLKSISVENLANFDENVNYNFPSMGIYVINRDIMIKLLTEHFPTATDLKSQVIPGAISLGMKVHAYQFDGYWEDMGSIAAYYRANMETIRRTNKAYNFYDRASPMYTLPRHLPPSLVTDAVITDSVIGDGCILCKCRIRGTVVGMRTRIGDDAVIEESNGVSEGEATGIPVGIGEGSHIRKAIIDKNARIGKNVMIVNKDSVQEGNMEANGYIISGGIVVVIRSAVIPDGSIL
ncbi:Inactive glucose-1-phosphate adenylyltransferase small subunit, chloroplastic [Sesamum angolense]|uniref:Inactive glucose-1-phosphate adenylyltransferase small subunit, chloroplastic n=1 Tax=Sesamum angolense TaxID=2727404 RepID=A0AAE1W6V5_9LAMI|nr:Inactive glucose-1-phosphate adenylyltransferase small subunit, chloroplastic [Sesamum angolense]